MIGGDAKGTVAMGSVGKWGKWGQMAANGTSERGREEVNNSKGHRFFLTSFSPKSPRSLVSLARSRQTPSGVCFPKKQGRCAVLGRGTRRFANAKCSAWGMDGEGGDGWMDGWELDAIQELMD